MSRTIGVMGAGLMASAIVRRLLGEGHAVSVWNRSAQKTVPLAAEGARAITDAASFFDTADVIIAALAGLENVTALLDTVEPRLEGKDFINLVTAGPGEVRALGSRIEDLGAHYLSGVIICYPSDILAGRGSIMIGGSSETWKRHGEIVLALASGSTYVGADPGKPGVIDSALTGGVIFTATTACLEAAQYAALDGMPLNEFRQFLSIYLKALPREIDRVLDAVAARKFTSSDATLDTYAASLVLFRDAFAKVGAPHSHLTATLAQTQAAIAEGKGPLGLAALAKA